MSHNALKVEGFEDFFPSGPQGENCLTVGDRKSGPHLILTVAEASRKLNIPQSTLYRRVRAGKYQTIEGEDGKSRIVLGNSENQMVPLEISVATIKNHLVPSENHTVDTESHSIFFLTKLVQDQASKLEAATYRNGFLEAQAQIYEQQVKLLPDFQAQTTKISLQEQKINELEIKLGQIKASWWYRLCSLVKRRK